MVRLEDIRVGDVLFYKSKDGRVVEVDVISIPHSETGFGCTWAGTSDSFNLQEKMLEHMYKTSQEVKQLTLF